MSPCDDAGLGVCRGTGEIRCRADGTGTECVITTMGSTPGTEICNDMDDDCNGRVDEGLTCTGSCTPMGAEVCNGRDDDCNGLVDESDPMLGTPCGMSVGVCEPGQICASSECFSASAASPRDPKRATETTKTATESTTTWLRATDARVASRVVSQSL